MRVFSHGGLIKAWIDGVPVEDEALDQVGRVSALPFVKPYVAVMPDVHVGMGATIGSVIPTSGAIIPAAVGVDIGCGMSCVKLNVSVRELGNLSDIRHKIERTVPHGRTDNGGQNDRGAWGEVPDTIMDTWLERLRDRYFDLVEWNQELAHKRPVHQLGTLGTGNHFIEVCGDQDGKAWIMLHSGSRGPGARMANFFIRKAKDHMKRWFIDLPDPDLAYLPEFTEDFGRYMQAVTFAQSYAYTNRQLMLEMVIKALGFNFYPSTTIDCHHNFVQKEKHFGQNVWVTRKGATRAGDGELGIIPGSMGNRSYIVKGKGNRDSLMSCSHGAGRVMSRKNARKNITVEEHAHDTIGVECRKDEEMLDESPRAYKNIDMVMAAQEDLVEVVHALKQVVCVKG